MSERNLDAYYFSFEATGCSAVDSILEAVASAGKGYHNTEDWREERDDGTSPLSDMQKAAEQSAAAVQELIAEIERWKAIAVNQKDQKNAALEIANERREERDQLKAENEALRKDRDTAVSALGVSLEEWSKLRKDAERYRWLSRVSAMADQLDPEIVDTAMSTYAAWSDGAMSG